jgi:pyruvate kinase
MISNRKMALSLAFGALSLSACGVRTHTTEISPGRRATCVEAVDTYTSRAQVPHDYRELAWITGEGNSVYTSDGKITDQIRKKAADVGANAIIVRDFGESGATTKVIGAALGANTADTKLSALAIYMPAEAGRVRARCGR